MTGEGVLWLPIYKSCNEVSVTYVSTLFGVIFYDVLQTVFPISFTVTGGVVG